MSKRFSTLFVQKNIVITETYTGELKTSEITCSIALFVDAPPVAIMRVLGPRKK